MVVVLPIKIRKGNGRSVWNFLSNFVYNWEDVPIQYKLVSRSDARVFQEISETMREVNLNFLVRAFSIYHKPHTSGQFTCSMPIFLLLN